MSRKVCLVIALAATLIIQCGEEGSFNPVGPPQRLVSIAGLTVSPTRIPAGGAQANISGNVVDQFGEPFRDVVVEFSAAKGAITAADTTTSTGAFQAVYTSGEDPGIDTVIATVAGISNSITLEIAAPSPDITLRVGKTSFLANGIDTTLVAAEIAYRGGSITRVPILFETTAGAFNGQTSTFAYAVEGRATVVLTSPSSNQTLTATITATIAELSAGAIGNNNPFPPALTGYYPPKSNAPYSPFILSSASTSALALASTSALASASRDASEARIAVILRGVTIKVEAADTLIPGDGQAQTAIRAFIKEENLQAVPDAPVTFSARYGSIPVTALTNDAGLAQVMLTSAPMPGVADRIVAKYGPVIADSIMISYAPAVGYVVLTADQTSIRGDGLRGTQLSARVFGGTGRPTPNVQVRFSADDGSLPVSRARTDDNGIAAVQYIAPSAENDRRITIRAEVAGGSSAPTPIIPPDEMYVIYDDDDDGDDDKNIYSNSDISLYKTNEQNPNPKAQSLKPKTQSLKPNKTQSQDIISDSLTLTIRGVQMRVDAFPDRIVARRGATASISASVFETTSGNPISDDTVRFAATNGQILGFAPLNANGQATATFTSSGLTGQAVIIARYGAAHADTTFIELLPTIGNLSLTAERGSMLAGGIDTIRVMARITDALGAASPGAEVWFSLGPAPLDSSLAITAEDGKASLLVVSPSVESDTTLQANAGSAGLRRSISLVVRSIARRSSASPDSLSAGAATPVTIIFQAFEQTSRRPVSGDTVWFSAINGVVQPFSMLNANGVAQTNFTVGNAVGEAWVIGQLGELKPDSVRIILVEPLFDLVVRAGRRSLLANGEDTTRLAIHTVNILGHPTPEVWVQFNPENCQVTPLSVRTNNDGFAEATLYSAASHLDDTAIVRISAFHSLRMLEDTNDDDDDDDDDKRYLIEFSKILGPPNRAEKESNSSLKGRLKSASSSNAKTTEQFDFSHLTNTTTSAARFDDKDLPVVKDFERKPSVSSLIQFDETDELVD
ncbi:MAG: hypothetical protein FJY65_05865, partial [Calditrichaeota bacterium]|nr:hypothetical protein [Calditrichota bacterium]